MGNLEQLATGTRADKPINVKRAEQEDKGVDRTTPNPNATPNIFSQNSKITR